MIHENKIAKILDLSHPRNLHPLKICTYTVSYIGGDILQFDPVLVPIDLFHVTRKCYGYIRIRHFGRQEQIST